MKVLILGCDGYIGWPLTIHLLNQGHQVCGLDNYCRRDRVEAINSNSITPIYSKLTRSVYLKTYSNFLDDVACINMLDYDNLSRLINYHKPDAIVHLAEQPSASWSMTSPMNAMQTQRDNVLGTLNLLWVMKRECPQAHLIKIGTMGEYGTPNCDIPEGFVPDYCMGGYGDLTCYPTTAQPIGECPMKDLLFPRSPGSFYHLSKVHDTHNIKFACDIWGLRSTDIMQGVVFGVGVTGDETEKELTRFDYDEYFGTAINRFCVQALCDHPFTIYGKGNQTRGYIPLKDSIQCLTIAIENPPNQGEYRTWNQFESIHSINELAELIQECALGLGISSSAKPIPNPRIEDEEHYYNPCCRTLYDLGYKPTTNIAGEIIDLLKDLMPYKDRIIKDIIMPKTTWRRVN